MDERLLFLATVIMTFAFMAAGIWVIHTISRNRRFDKLIRMHGELQTRIVEKLGSPDAVAAYLGSESGRRLLDESFAEGGAPSRSSPHGRILSSVQAGILLTLAGIAVLAAGAITGGWGDTIFAFVGLLALALGVGFLISARAAHVLSKRYGLIADRRRETAS